MGGQSHDGSTEWKETVCFWLFTYPDRSYSCPPCNCLYNMLSALNNRCGAAGLYI